MKLNRPGSIAHICWLADINVHSICLKCAFFGRFFYNILEINTHNTPYAICCNKSFVSLYLEAERNENRKIGKHCATPGSYYFPLSKTFSFVNKILKMKRISGLPLFLVAEFILGKCPR